MTKGVFRRQLQLRDFLEPFIILPYGFWGIYWFENGVNWIVGTLGAVLFFVLLPIVIVLWDKK